MQTENIGNPIEDAFVQLPLADGRNAGGAKRIRRGGGTRRIDDRLGEEGLLAAVWTLDGEDERRILAAGILFSLWKTSRDTPKETLAN